MLDISALKPLIEGELYTDLSSRIRYATDASVYKELPVGIVYPKTEKDISHIIRFAAENKIPLIPRAAGTSLAGQVVGNGLVVDISHHFNRIVEINKEESYAIVQPGVVRDELNMQLASSGLFFAPETSTSNRCHIGGMCGNNSCGANSLIYGSTRQHIISVRVILSDGSIAEFGELGRAEFEKKCLLESFEGKLYRDLYRLLSPEAIKQEIREQYPDPSLKRRSMGYAIDELIQGEPFEDKGDPFNFCTLITGSEGTLAFITELKIRLSPLPSPYKALYCIETHTLEEALEGNLIGLEFEPASIELIDKLILDLAERNISQRRNRFFLQGDPGAILIIEIVEKSYPELLRKTESLKQAFQKHSIGYAYTLIEGYDMKRVWALRKAGLGVMSNVKGDRKPVTVVEDVAVSPEKYPDYYKDFKSLLNEFGLECAFYGHISTGELHNKPLFNLKDKSEIGKFREFAYRNALLVKKWGGTLSGEHGDGRLRGEFLPVMIGEKNYRLCEEIKSLFDPGNILNPGKIVDTPRMNTHLRYDPLPFPETKKERRGGKDTLNTFFDFSDTDGILRAIEKCNGSGDCKKSHLFDGAMCPSYQVTSDEKYSTRARANILREFITHSEKRNPFDYKEIWESLDWCLACKACKSECPSNVDMTKLRAEFLYHYYKQHVMPVRSRIIGYYPLFNKWGTLFAPLYNLVCTHKRISPVLKSLLGFAKERSLPPVSSFSLKKWSRKHTSKVTDPIKSVYFFNDEFSNTTDVAIAVKAIKLLEALHYEVKIVDNTFSGRTFLSKGDLKKARKLAEKNIRLYAPLINEETPLIGLEPSAILSFRDEYPELVNHSLKGSAERIGRNTYLIDEFIADEFEKGHIPSSSFTRDDLHILFHSHCYQKALSTPGKSVVMMQIPANYRVTEIKSGCCGMAGAFGYEKEHYPFSMKVGELSLFPAIRSKPKESQITATGTSCRHQIKDGTRESAKHPVEILYDALLK